MNVVYPTKSKVWQETEVALGFELHTQIIYKHKYFNYMVTILIS
jgi:hypothetical protein